MVALVRGVHGLNGALRVEVLTDRPEARFAAGAILYREGSETALHVIDGVPIADGPGWRIRLAEAVDRTAAEAYRGAYLEALVPVMPAVPAGMSQPSFLWHEVVGLPVAGRDGEELGTVTDIYRVAENDVYVVRGPRGEFDVPAVRDFVLALDPRAGRAGRRCGRPRPAAGSSAQAVSRAPSAQGRGGPGGCRATRLRRRSRPVRRRRSSRSRRRLPRRPPGGTPEPDDGPRDRRPDPVPGDDRRTPVGRAFPDGSRSEAWPRSGSTTCAIGASAGIDRSTTARTVAVPG